MSVEKVELCYFDAKIELLISQISWEFVICACEAEKGSLFEIDMNYLKHSHVNPIS